MILSFMSFRIFFLPAAGLANQVLASQARDGSTSIGRAHAPLFAVVLIIVGTASAAVLLLYVLPKRREIQSACFSPEQQWETKTSDNESSSFLSEYGLSDAVLVVDENDVASDMPWIRSEEFDPETVDETDDEEQELGSEPGYG
jgi:hypothetical protein